MLVAQSSFMRKNNNIQHFISFLCNAMTTEKTYEWTGMNDIDSLRKNVFCFEVQKDHAIWTLLETSNVTFTLFIVLEGKITIRLDEKTYEIEKNNSIFLTPFHHIKIETLSDDIRCEMLSVNKNMMEEIRGIETSFKHIVLILRSHRQPVSLLQEDSKTLLLDDFSLIKKRLAQTSHLYQKELVYTALADLLFDVGDVYWKKERLMSTCPHSEYLMHQFTQLLMAHYKSEHEVIYYSSQLNITPQYLSSIIRNATGQTVGSFIYNMIFDEACNLLKLSQMSVQQIADELHFSDQSAFGKFFKRKSGISPNEYRKKIRS